MKFVNYIIELLPAMIIGVSMTLKIFLITLLLSIPFGIVLALLRNSRIKIVSKTVGLYIWIMRGTPLMLQIVFIFFGLPVVNISLDRFLAVILAFVLNYGAYFGEIFRAGINSIDKGQYEAAQVLGFSEYETFKRIILPQTIKRILPALTNEVITLIKDTSLVYIVGLGELLRAGKIASNRDVSLIPLLLVGVIYLILTGTLTVIFDKLESKQNYYE